MESKIFKLQLAVYKCLKLIFVNTDIEVLTVLGGDKMFRNFIHIESIKKEREVGDFNKFTITLAIQTFGSSYILISSIIEKIENSFKKEKIENFLKEDFLSFNLIETQVNSLKEVGIIGRMVFICFF
jgi:hypothetical protein